MVEKYLGIRISKNNLQPLYFVYQCSLYWNASVGMSLWLASSFVVQATPSPFASLFMVPRVVFNHRRRARLLNLCDFLLEYLFWLLSILLLSINTNLHSNLHLKQRKTQKNNGRLTSRDMHKNRVIINNPATIGSSNGPMGFQQICLHGNKTHSAYFMSCDIV